MQCLLQSTAAESPNACVNMAFYKDPVRGRSFLAVAFSKLAPGYNLQVHRQRREREREHSTTQTHTWAERERKEKCVQRTGEWCSPVDTANDTASTTAEGWPEAALAARQRLLHDQMCSFAAHFPSLAHSSHSLSSTSLITAW